MPIEIIDLERTKQERKSQLSPPEEQKYPWGMSIHLDKEEIDKLGLEQIEPGAKFAIAGEAVVTSVSKRADEAGEDRSVSLQITDLGVEPIADKRSAAEILYGKG